MAVAVANEALAVSSDVRISPPQRHMLLVLAHGADAETRFTWMGHAKLRASTGLSETVIRKGIATLEREGMISTWRRSGKVPLYLIHPNGLSALLPPDYAALSRHLAKGHFTRADMESVNRWRADLHRAANGDPQPRDSLDADPRATRGGASNTPAPHAGDPHATRGGTPAPRAAESKLNSNRKRKADDRPAKMDGLADHREVPGQASPANQPPAPASTTVAEVPPLTGAKRYQGSPPDVVARLLAEEGMEASRLGAMTDAEQLAHVEHMQRLLRVRPPEAITRGEAAAA